MVRQELKGSLWQAVLFVAALMLPGAATGALVDFQAGTLPQNETHHEVFVLPLAHPADIAHAPHLLAQAPADVSATLLNADIAARADSIHFNPLTADPHLWDRITRFNGVGEVGVELLDGWPSFLDQDIDGWIRNTNGRIEFWNYRVTSEFARTPQPVPHAIPLDHMLPAAMAIFGAVVVTFAITRRSHRRT